MTTLSISLLGPIAVTRDGAPLAVPSGKTTQLLIRLALETGTHVSADRLIDDLWGEAVATTDRDTLRAKVSALFMTPLGWGWAAFVWGYAIAWALVNDRIKLLAYRILDPGGSRPAVERLPAHPYTAAEREGAPADSAAAGNVTVETKGQP